MSVNRTSGRRSYAENTYHAIATPRPNYFVLLGADVTKVNFAPHVSPAKATGVDFVFEGHTYSVQARKEIVLSAGKYLTLVTGCYAHVENRLSKDSSAP